MAYLYTSLIILQIIYCRTCPLPYIVQKDLLRVGSTFTHEFYEIGREWPHQAWNVNIPNWTAHLILNLFRNTIKVLLVQCTVVDWTNYGTLHLNIRENWWAATLFFCRTNLVMLQKCSSRINDVEKKGTAFVLLFSLGHKLSSHHLLPNFNLKVIDYSKVK